MEAKTNFLKMHARVVSLLEILKVEVFPNSLPYLMFICILFIKKNQISIEKQKLLIIKHQEDTLTIEEVNVLSGSLKGHFND